MADFDADTHGDGTPSESGRADGWIGSVLHIQFEANVLIVTLKELPAAIVDVQTRERFRRYLGEIPDQPTGAVFDLDGHEVIPSTVLGIMVALRIHLHNNEGTMAVCNASAMTIEKMQRLNLTSLWTISRSRLEALKDVVGRKNDDQGQIYIADNRNHFL